MKNKIVKEALEWYENQRPDEEVNLEDFVDIVIDKTADSIFEKVKAELRNEFENGNLNHPFVISSDYYLDLKLKDIKNQCIKKIEKIEEE